MITCKCGKYSNINMQWVNSNSRNSLNTSWKFCPFCGSRFFQMRAEYIWILETDPEWIDGSEFCEQCRVGQCMCRVWSDGAWRINGIPGADEEMDIDYYEIDYNIDTEIPIEEAKARAIEAAEAINKELSKIDGDI